MRKKICNKKGQELITLAEAEELGYAKVSALKMRIHKGKLKAIKIGRDWLIVKEDVKRKPKT